jgi:hypothetical protein
VCLMTRPPKVRADPTPTIDARTLLNGTAVGRSGSARGLAMTFSFLLSAFKPTNYFRRSENLVGALVLKSNELPRAVGRRRTCECVWDVNSSNIFLLVN